MKSKRRTVMVFGTFDLLHEGHRYVFREAKKRGDRLVAVVARDKTVRNLKKFRPAQSERSRLHRVARLPEVDQAVLGQQTNFYASLQRIKPDVVCLGYDQRSPIVSGLAAALKKLRLETKIVRLRAHKPEKYKSSILRKEKRPAYHNGKRGA